MFETLIQELQDVASFRITDPDQVRRILAEGAKASDRFFSLHSSAHTAFLTGPPKSDSAPA